uniref:C-Type Lectin-like membrane protein n=1 Tax=Gallus gallus TaxID=9031 RepID=A0A023PS04_CHICK|nr:C-Type Lectin-like membrane protein [Gallus gallus]
MDSQRGAKDANLSLRCIKDKLLPIAGTVLVAALLIAVIALAAAPHLPGCPNDGIGVGLQCFYFVEDAADWDGGQRFCLSRGAQLAAVGTPQELYWIGLRRDRSGPWMWANGSLFNNAFSIEGSGRCAHTDGGGIGSAECSRPKRSVCSRPQRGGAEL